MDQSKGTVPDRTCAIGEVMYHVILYTLIAFLLTACWHNPPAPPVTVKTELELAVENIKEEWLKPCEPLPSPPESNSIGTLLMDAAASIGVGAECATRHNSFVDYLTPVVNKQKATAK